MENFKLSAFLKGGGAESLSVGQRIADAVTTRIGSWPFLITQTLFLFGWVVVNTRFSLWDPYPFILLNLFLSLQAAYMGPIVMVSQNRQAERDRIIVRHSYEMNQQSERDLQLILEELARQGRALERLFEELDRLRAEVRRGSFFEETKGPE
jgi:uncharacterized membrane protein